MGRKKTSCSSSTCVTGHRQVSLSQHYEKAFIVRLTGFLMQPWPKKSERLRAYARHAWLKMVGSVPVVIRLPFGCWWIVWNDVRRSDFLTGRFDLAEQRFVGRFLQPGMTALDIGAYHGFYTLLASRKVGPLGRVVAFEPSPRQIQRLVWHLKLNHCENVIVERVALGSSEGESEFFVVGSGSEGCSSLRPPNDSHGTTRIRVPLTTLDACLDREQIKRVDFIKVDAEGGEWEILKGSRKLLEHEPRPVILCELQEIRTEPWNYQPNELTHFLRRYGYRWFRVLHDGSLLRLPEEQESFEGNFVAVPNESMNQIPERREHEPVA